MNWIKQILLLILLLLIQVLVLQNLHLVGLCHPYIYVLFLLYMPRLPRWAELLIAAALGCVMDIFCTSPGVHMAACVAVGFIRGLLLDRIGPESKRITGMISSASLGKVEFIKWTIWLVLCHHCLVFWLEAWSLQLLAWSLLCAIVSSVMTIVLAFGYNTLVHD